MLNVKFLVYFNFKKFLQTEDESMILPLIDYRETGDFQKE